MIYLLGGASHTGKTLLAQRLLERTQIPYLSIDHLKMGLIRSGQTTLTPLDDERLTDYLWPIVREMVKTAIENAQNLIVEGCYIPCDWQKDFPDDYLAAIRCFFLVFSETYIEQHGDDILRHENAIERRLCSEYPKAAMLADNRRMLAACQAHGCRYLLIDSEYDTERLVSALLNE